MIQSVGRRPKGRPRNRWEDDIKMEQIYWDPDDRRQQLGEEYFRYISTRRRWQKSSTTAKYVTKQARMRYGLITLHACDKGLLGYFWSIVE